MSTAKVMITYKRKRAATHAHTEDDTVLDSSPAASSNVAVSSLQLKPEGPAETAVINEYNHITPKMQQSFSMFQQNIKEEREPEKGHDQLYESSPWKEQPEICSATIASTAEAHSNKSQCIDGTNSQTPVSSSLCGNMLADRMINQTKDSNISAPVEINSPTGMENAVAPGQCKSRFSPLLTFRRRVKKKTNLDEPAEEICSLDNDKQCSTLTCSPPRSSQDATSLLKHTAPNPLDIEDKVGRLKNTGPSTEAEHSPEQESSHVVKSSVQHVVPQIALDVNQNIILEDDVTPMSNQKMSLEDDVTPMSKFTGVQEVSGQDTPMEDSNRTSPNTIKVPKVIDLQGKGHCTGETTSLQSPRQKVDASWLKQTNKSVAEDVPESQGSTKNIPIILLDDDNDERGKELENSEALDQGLHSQNKRTFGKIDLNCTELRQQGLLCLDDSTIQRLPDLDLAVNARKQMSRPIERLFFTEEKDTIRGKQEHHEESSTMHAPYSNFFDLGPPWNTGSLKGPKGLPSEVKFGIMDRAPEFSLDLRLDSFTDNNSVAALRSDKLFLGGASSTSRKLTEKLGMYSYKRQSAPWSEEELDFLWIGVRRYGVNNWNAMLRDSRLRFSISRMPEDLAKQWDKEQKKLVGPAQAVGYLGRASCSGCSKSASVGAQAQTDLSLGEYYLGRASCSGCSKSSFLGAQTDLSLGDVYLRSGRAPERGHQHHLPSLGVGASLGGGFPGASSSYGRSGGRRRRASKSYYYENKSAWFQEPPSDRVPQQPGGRMGPEMWPSIMVVPPPAADPPRDDDVKPHVLLPDATLKRAIRRSADWGSFSRRLFLSGDLNGGAAGAPVPSDTGASSEETVSDS